MAGFYPSPSDVDGGNVCVAYQKFATTNENIIFAKTKLYKLYFTL